MLQALRDPRFRLLWLTGLAASTARWMDIVVLGWLALALTDSPFLVGVAAFFRAAPMMALGPFAGVLADRFPRGRLMMAVQAANVALMLTLAGLFATGHGRFPVLVGLEVLLGVAWALDFPSRRALLVTVVGRARLTNAVSLESLSTQGSMMAGPAIGGLLLASLGPAPCYLVLAGLSAAAGVAAWRLDRAVALPGMPGMESVAAALLEGLREARGHPAIVAVLAVTVVMNTLVFPFQQMLPVVARDVLGVGPGWLGLLVAMEGLGAFTGSLALAARAHRPDHARVFGASSLAVALLVIALASSPWYALSVAIQLVIGVAEAGFGVMQSAIVLLAAPERARGRAMGILSACIGTQPLGSLWVGFLTGRIGAPLAGGLDAAVASLLLLLMVMRLATRPAGVRAQAP